MKRTFACLLVTFLATSVALAQNNCGDCNLDGSPDPTILDALTAAQITAGIMPAMGLQPCACDVNSAGGIDIIDTLLMAQRAAGLPIALACSSPVCGVPFNTAPQVVINSPMGGSICGSVTIDFDATDIDGDPLDTTVEFSSNGGASWAIAKSTGTGSLTMIPTGFVAGALGQTFVWDSRGDTIGLLGPFVAVVRVRSTDGMDESLAQVAIVVDNSFGFVEACAGSRAVTTGAGSGGAVMTFDPCTDSTPFTIDARGRPVGGAIEIVIANLDDDFDLWIAKPGIPFGDTNPANYDLAYVGGLSGTGTEFHWAEDADLTALGDFVQCMVHHYGSNPTGRFDLFVTCFAIEPCAGSIDCGGAPLQVTTGSIGSTMIPPTFTTGPGGDSAFVTVDTSGRAGGDVEIRGFNQNNDIALLVQVPDLPCGWPLPGSWTGIQSFNAGDDFLLMSDALLNVFPGGIVPMLVYNVNPSGMAGTTDVEMQCVPTGPCSGTIACGGMVDSDGVIGMGTQYFIGGVGWSFGPPGGDSHAYELDLSGLAPGGTATITLQSIDSDFDLITQPPGVSCGFPLPWIIGAFSSQNPGVGVNDVATITELDLQGLGTTLLTIVVYHVDPDATGHYVLTVTCM